MKITDEAVIAPFCSGIMGSEQYSRGSLVRKMIGRFLAVIGVLIENASGMSYTSRLDHAFPIHRQPLDNLTSCIRSMIWKICEPVMQLIIMSLNR